VSLATPAPSGRPAAPVDPLAEVVRWSRAVGEDPSLVLSGGGNTSVKVVEADVLGRPVAVLRVKGSGSDLRTIRPADFSGVRLDDVLPLFDGEDMSDEEMVAYLARCLVDPASPRPSIETLLHAFVPAPSVFHSHADAVLALVNAPEPLAAVRAAFGDRVLTVPYRRPGFLLSKEVGAAVRERPDALGLVLLNHGAVTWGATPEEAYRRHLELVELAREHVERHAPERVFVAAERYRLAPEDRRRAAAALSPVLRGALSEDRRLVARWCDDPEVLAFTGSERARAASAAGAATPDHILTTKRLPLWVDAPEPLDAEAVAASLRRALGAWRADYRAYVDRWRTEEPRLPPSPRVVLVPGLGMWSVGATARQARLAGEIYLHTIGVMAGAEATGGYLSLSEEEAFRAEYWPLELYKLTLAPPERELAGRVALVTGAGGGIGRAVALRLAAAGAHVVVTDLDGARASSVAAEIAEHEGAVASFGTLLDVTDPAQVEGAFERALLEYGGVDVVVSNAGVAHCAPLEGLELEDWERSLAVNATGHFLVARGALRLLRRQGRGGSLVFVATKNVTAPGAGFGAYSAAKAAEAQLARVAALEGGPIGVRSNLVNPDAVFDTGLWTPEVREERARSHGIAVEEVEAFYRGRNLLGAEVRAADVAEAVLFLAGDRASRTTGAMLPVDGGVREAFVR
jgi:rhamnulose-1-phosphate aldolase/alcohol dehydrogenase